jgi:hypothetical protein
MTCGAHLTVLAERPGRHIRHCLLRVWFWGLAASPMSQTGVLYQNGGGVATLISRFTDADLGDHVQS